MRYTDTSDLNNYNSGTESLRTLRAIPFRALFSLGKHTHNQKKITDAVTLSYHKWASSTAYLSSKRTDSKTPSAAE